MAYTYSYDNTQNDDAYVPAPEGAQVCLCTKFIDLGTQEDKYNPGETVRQCVLGFRLVTGLKQEVMTKRYRLSLHKTASLFKDCNAWLGSEVIPPEGGEVDFADFLGKPAIVNIVHNKGKDDQVWANIKGFGPVPEGVPIPDVTFETQFLWVPAVAAGDAPMVALMEELTPYWCVKAIKASRELTGGQQQSHLDTLTEAREVFA